MEEKTWGRAGIFKKNYLLIWLHHILVVACGLCIWGTQRSPVGACRPSCSVACGILISPTRDRTHGAVSARQILNHWTTREVPRAGIFRRILLDSAGPHLTLGTWWTSWRPSLWVFFLLLLPLSTFATLVECVCVYIYIYI